MKYHVWVVGCQMNKADSQRLASRLESLGLIHTEQVEQADVVVINSCAVRQSAEERVLSKIGALKQFKRRRPDALLALMGCMVGSEHQVKELRRRMPHVDLFLRPLEDEALLSVVQARLSDRADLPQACELLGEDPPAPAIPRSAVGNPTRWVPIIYGCDRFCSYCIVPHRRGRERSRPLDEVVAEVRAHVRWGAKEVTLLGQIIDRYGFDLPGRPDLADLLQRLHPISGLERIRFLTSHPSDMTDRVIQAIATLPKVCEHVNLPVQSGDDVVLEKMGRGYTAEQYRRLVERIRQAMPEVSLATDLIVGFPGESDEQFQRSYDLLADIGFDVVHVAMYSPRPGTRAAKLLDDVPAEVKKERLQRVEALQEATASSINERLRGRSLEVLVEGRTKGKWQGRTRGNKLVFFVDPAEASAPVDRAGSLVGVHIERTSPWALQGRVLE